MATRVERAEPPLIVIVGPTASGKTGLAIDVAEQYGGEIICADSRTIYRGMDIGTAKPSSDEQARVPHWGLDLVNPGQRFTAADFKGYVDHKITEIRQRGAVPFLVGGTGLYVDSVVFDYQFGEKADEARRADLQTWTVEVLYQYCIKHNIILPENIHNKRYLIRAIERKDISIKGKTKLASNTIVVGIATNRHTLRTRIEDRAEQILTNAVVEEATLLGEKYGWDNEAMTGNIYPLLRLYLEGELTSRELKDKFTTSDWRLAKRQLTWMRRNPYVYWASLEESNTYITQSLASWGNS